MTRIYKEFHFDAAHFLPYAEEGHPNRRMHGHSFRVVVWLKGKPAPETGLVRHFEDLEREVMAVREKLDHHLLNEVAGLELPTLERIAAWIWHELAAPLPEIACVEVHRGSCREGCVYDGPQDE
ncbi:6-carboxytetrahydropterin synthase [uncultured Parvibaculum sp.]|uniref:6-pyruvoyl trahydropterin synthase family protein n=1 Tax=uncultured Parvibaculum sp. TaxID=291828 RepID=UPI0030DCC4A9|tara:strand:+ start:102991 stop:103362 length:372 start_codon:yes stop_codon:yes gene_type:complete